MSGHEPKRALTVDDWSGDASPSGAEAFGGAAAIACPRDPYLRFRRVDSTLPRTPRSLLIPAVPLLVLVDLAACAVAAAVAFAAAGAAHGPRVGVAFGIAAVVALAAAGTYEEAFARRSWPEQIGRICSAVALAAVVVLAAVRIDGTTAASRFALGAMIASGAIVAARSVVLRIGARPQRVLIVGAGNAGQALAAKLVSGVRRRTRVVGFVDPDPRAVQYLQLLQTPVFSTWQEALENVDPDRVVLAFSQLSDVALLELVDHCDRVGIKVSAVPRLFELIVDAPGVEFVAGLPLIDVSAKESSPLVAALRRALDVVLASLLLLLALPLLGAIAIGIKLHSPGPVFFWQTRVGRYQEKFRMLKFRTMATDAFATAPRAGHKCPGDPRVTRFGQFLRVSSLDELPQLWNVVRGEMSLVGPRPLPVYEFVGREPEQGRRLDVRPGLTGLWQVVGRSDVAFEERMRLDHAYVRTRSLRSDVLLLLRTIEAVVARRGAC